MPSSTAVEARACGIATDSGKLTSVAAELQFGTDTIHSQRLLSEFLNRQASFPAEPMLAPDQESGEAEAL